MRCTHSKTGLRLKRSSAGDSSNPGNARCRSFVLSVVASRSILPGHTSGSTLGRAALIRAAYPIANWPFQRCCPHRPMCRIRKQKPDSALGGLNTRGAIEAHRPNIVTGPNSQSPTTGTTQSTLASLMPAPATARTTDAVRPGLVKWPETRTMGTAETKISGNRACWEEYSVSNRGKPTRR